VGVLLICVLVFTVFCFSCAVFLYYFVDVSFILYFSPTIVRVINSRRMIWKGHIARMREGAGVYRFWWENMRERDHWGDSGVDGRII
jgi:hypothetical protein